MPNTSRVGRDNLLGDIALDCSFFRFSTLASRRPIGNYEIGISSKNCIFFRNKMSMKESKLTAKYVGIQGIAHVDCPLI